MNYDITRCICTPTFRHPECEFSEQDHQDCKEYEKDVVNGKEKFTRMPSEKDKMLECFMDKKNTIKYYLETDIYGNTTHVIMPLEDWENCGNFIP